MVEFLDSIFIPHALANSGDMEVGLLGLQTVLKIPITNGLVA